MVPGVVSSLSGCQTPEEKISGMRRVTEVTLEKVSRHSEMKQGFVKAAKVMNSISLSVIKPMLQTEAVASLAVSARLTFNAGVLADSGILVGRCMRCSGGLSDLYPLSCRTASETHSQFSIRAATANIDMVDGLFHVAKRMEWYMLLHTLLLERLQSSNPVHDNQHLKLRDRLRKSIQELYSSLLVYEMQCVCYCYRDSRITRTFRALVTLDDWKGKLTH